MATPANKDITGWPIQPDEPFKGRIDGGSPLNSRPFGDVAILGIAAEDEVLTAYSTLSDLDGLGTFSYQWHRDDVDISLATASTYTLVTADVGTVITVTISYTDGSAQAEGKTSAGTASISAASGVTPVFEEDWTTDTTDDYDFGVLFPTTGSPWTITHNVGGGLSGNYVRMRLNNHLDEHGYYDSPNTGPNTGGMWFGETEFGTQTGQLNLGMVVRFGSNFTPPMLLDDIHADRHKWMCIKDDGNDRPINMLQPAKPLTTPRYYTLSQHDNANAGTSFGDEFGDNFADSANAHTFNMDDLEDTGEWVYIEMEVQKSGGVHTTLFQKQAGSFVEVGHSDSISTGSFWENAIIGYYMIGAGTEVGAAVDTDANTYMDVDLVRISNERMGPPSYF